MQSQNKIPLYKQIALYIQEKGRAHSGDIEIFSIEQGYKAKTGDRRAEELVQKDHRNFNPNIRAVIEKGCVVYYWQETTQQNAPRQEQKIVVDSNTGFNVNKWLSQFKKPEVKETQRLF